MRAYLSGVILGLFAGVVMTVCLEQDSARVRDQLERWRALRAQHQMEYAEYLLSRHTAAKESE